jgi:GT2 family glycosyltransferase
MVNRCVKSLLKYEPLSEQDIWIFDDGSPYFDENLFTTKRVIRRENNKGYATTINDAMRVARKYGYHVICTVNSDIEFTQSVSNRACNVFNFDSKIAVIGGMLLYPTGHIQSAGFGIDNIGNPIEYFKKENIAYGNVEANKPKFTMGVTGALQFIRLDAIDTIGYYDENFKLSYEDVEFCYRTWIKNYKVFYDPHIKAIHAESATRGYFVGEKEYDSVKHWLKIFKANRTYTKALQKIEDANLSSQQITSSRMRSEQLAQAIRHSHSTQSDEKA